MSHCNSVNVDLFNCQFNKLKSTVKNANKLTLKLPSYMIGDFINKTLLSHKLLLTDREVSKLRKVFANNSSVNIKLSNLNYLK